MMGHYCKTRFIPHWRTRFGAGLLAASLLLVSTCPGYAERLELNEHPTVPPHSPYDPGLFESPSASAATTVNDPTANKAAYEFEAFLDTVERHHPDLIQADLDRKIYSAKRLEKQGAFDPALNNTTTVSRFNSSSDIGHEQDVMESRTAVEFLTRQGTKVSLGYLLANGDIKTPVSPTGDGGEPYVSLTVPLLRGNVTNVKSVAEKQAFLSESQAGYKYYLKRLELLLKATSTYWKWVSAVQKQAIEKNLLDLAVQRRDMVIQLANAGDVAQLDVVEAEQELQTRQTRYVAAKRAVQAATLSLSLFLWNAQGQPLPAVKEAQAPTQMPNTEPVPLDELKLAKIDALRLRPEFDILEASVAISKLDRKLAANQLLPQLDAIAGTGYELGANAIDNTYKVGAQLSIPLRRRTARGQLDQAKLTLEQLSVQEKQLIQSVFVQLEDVYSQLSTTADQITATQAEVAFAKTMAEGERTRYELGDSTLFVLNRRERAWAESQQKLLDLQAQYQVALVALKAARGNL